ncbi:MAG: nuclear transport factor 2 family protein [Actinomycetota bacterium]|nr:nuclear transport factor 2 family protein [Actinomycetota bacterium]
MTDHPNLDLLRRGYDAYVSGDMATINELFADDVVWHVAGRSPLAGDHTGKEQVFGFFGKLQEMSDGTSKIDVHELLASDTHGVALVTESATRNGKHNQSNAVHVLHLRDGKVTEFWDAHPDQYTVDDFWS